MVTTVNKAHILSLYDRPEYKSFFQLLAKGSTFTFVMDCMCEKSSFMIEWMNNITVFLHFCLLYLEQ